MAAPIAILAPPRPALEEAVKYLPSAANWRKMLTEARAQVPMLEREPDPLPPIIERLRSVERAGDG